jgi:hypothetical protein
MDLLEILRTRAVSLPEGDYTLGISAVIQHIETASKHLGRGQTSTDETAFTDAIYRTNQAFEGSLKEAYRVLTGKDPARETPNDIELYLQQQNRLRPRVLAQFTKYRKEWRNPSTHDYRLEFDEDEALLAIVTVCAFAIVLIDQITEQISFDRTKATTHHRQRPVSRGQSLLHRVRSLFPEFVSQFNQGHARRHDFRETEVIGALAGFLSSAAPDIRAHMEEKLHTQRTERADLVLESSGERLLVEVKRRRLGVPLGMGRNMRQVSNYMALSDITEAILFVFIIPNNGTITQMEYDAQGTPGRIVVISTNG